MRAILHILALILISNLIDAQSGIDFPSSLPYSTRNGGISNQIVRTDSVDIKLKHRVLVNPDSGIEYYINGNIHATGGLIKLREITEYRMVDSTRERITEYVRHGLWTVYYNTDSLKIRSIGEFVNGEKTGDWKFYHEASKLPFLIRTYSGGLIKEEITYSDSGEITSHVSKSDFELFLIENYVLFILLALLPITLIRITSNIITYNKIYDTKYVPGVHKWQKGGVGVNLYTTFIFWWIAQPFDKLEIKRAKRISNIISIVSIIIFLSVLIVFKIYNLTSD